MCLLRPSPRLHTARPHCRPRTARGGPGRGGRGRGRYFPLLRLRWPRPARQGAPGGRRGGRDCRPPWREGRAQAPSRARRSWLPIGRGGEASCLLATCRSAGAWRRGCRLFRLPGVSLSLCSSGSDERWGASCRMPLDARARRGGCRYRPAWGRGGRVAPGPGTPLKQAPRGSG